MAVYCKIPPEARFFADRTREYIIEGHWPEAGQQVVIATLWGTHTMVRSLATRLPRRLPRL